MVSTMPAMPARVRVGRRDRARPGPAAGEQTQEAGGDHHAQRQQDHVEDQGEVGDHAGQQVVDEHEDQDRRRAP